MKYEFGFIGCGNMGGALARAVARRVAPKEIGLYDTDVQKAKQLCEELGAGYGESEKILAGESRFLVFGVKPQVLPCVLRELRDSLTPETVLISMAAGVSCAAIRAEIGEENPVIRIMPNLPVALGEGIVLYTGQKLSSETEEAFCRAFSGAGLVDAIEESRMDAASALTGCGPAYVYIFAEALADAAVECGLPRAAATAYAARTLCGAGRMIEAFGQPATLKDAVCSAGGTTIAGVHALERGGFRAAAMDAVTAAYRRTLELAAKK